MDLNRPLSSITPTLDGDVLTVLANADDIFTTGRLHRLLPRASEQGIRKVLQRPVAHGLVLSNRVGNAYMYRFNRDHLAAQHIIGLAQIKQNLLDRLADRLESWDVPPIYAAVFGSTARGSMTVESDLDLLLVRPDNVDDDQWAAQVDSLVAEVTLWIGNDVRALEFAAKEIATSGHREPVLRDVLDEGLTVAGNRAWLIKQLRKGKN
ncbi:nucleotidyltransferase domain-containing protein [Actinokineospora xionganensis]|uniref:Nucleotidyltransferase domain-containing protein n=1 Tax=Actinokineospora xionganensis TaxID=2684470 RepID=A0ABR7LAK0_9PSEU|nr:nucleotidyltransferase domain-containing protein [Actinokineospora xionganensis]MBC6449720.1 nucleotidyltransferase domain-containing protein [Actinokineospora xionganensis]